MSAIGTIAKIGTGLSAVANLISLFDGSSILQLGSFQFQGFELPEKITWGGQQQLIVHKLPGGPRVIDAMGRDDAVFSWTGQFIGTNATARAQALDALRVAGKPLTLTWSTFSFQVVIRDITFENRYFFGKYEIKCEWLGAPQTPPKPSLLQTVINDINSALGINIQGAVAQINPILSAVSTVSTSAAALTGLVGGTPTAITMVGSLGTATTASNSVLTSANASVTNLPNQIASAGSDQRAVATHLGNAAIPMQQIPAITTQNAYLNRASKNLRNRGA